MTDRYRILAGPGSPYSHKVRAVMRYRRIPHDWVIPMGDFDGTAQRPIAELVAGGKRLLPTVQFPDGSYWADSTPIIHELETRLPNLRSVLPPSPAERVLARIVEDYADEWLTVILVAYRWTSDEDVAFCARRQMHGWLGAVSEEQLGAGVARMTGRMQAVRLAIGGAPEARAAFDAEYEALLDILEAGLSRELFLFGDAPSIADFGLYGMLSQFAVDPTPSRMMRGRAVRLFQWVQYADDLSGHKGDWRASREPGETLKALVRLSAGSLLPLMQGNRKAIAAGQRGFTYEVRGATLMSRTRAYTDNCWLWLKAMFAELGETDRESLRPLLEPSGYWDALALAPDEHVPSFAMI